MNREELIDSLRERVAELEAELAVSDILLIERQKLLSAIPGCDSHGECVPHAQEWIEKAIAAFGAELVIEPDRALGVESLCLCDNHISLDMVSGGAAKCGYLGEVTLSVDGEYVRYSRIGSDSPLAKQSVVVPEGWVLVPVEPTKAMSDAIDLLCDEPLSFDDSGAFWRYLLIESPSHEGKA